MHCSHMVLAEQRTSIFLDFRELTKDMLKTTKKAITKKGHRVVNAIIDQELKLTPQKTTNIVRTIDI